MHPTTTPPAVVVVALAASMGSLTLLGVLLLSIIRGFSPQGAGSRHVRTALALAAALAIGLALTLAVTSGPGSAAAAQPLPLAPSERQLVLSPPQRSSATVPSLMSPAAVPSRDAAQGVWGPPLLLFGFAVWATTLHALCAPGAMWVAVTAGAALASTVSPFVTALVLACACAAGSTICFGLSRLVGAAASATLAKAAGAPEAQQSRRVGSCSCSAMLAALGQGMCAWIGRRVSALGATAAPVLARIESACLAATHGGLWGRLKLLGALTAIRAIVPVPHSALNIASPFLGVPVVEFALSAGIGEAPFILGCVVAGAKAAGAAAGAVAGAWGGKA